MYYYGNGSGQLKYGFSYIGNDTYYSDNTGKVLTGDQTIDGYKYYFQEDGKMFKGFRKIGNDLYYYGNGSGQLKYGWSSIGNNKYYSDSNGIIQIGSKIIEGKAYNFDNSGVLQTGWQEINGSKYYFYADGSRANLISKIADKRYEFTYDGRLQYENIKLVADVSSYQGNIDWDTLWNSGEIDGVVLRISAGIDSEDFMLENYIKNVQRLNIPYGVYIYSYAENYNEGRQYGDFTLSKISKYKMNPTLGIYFDLENNAITKYMGPSEYEPTVKGYMDVVPNAKIYTYTNYANTALKSDYIQSYIDWIADYTVSDRPEKYWKWQWTSKGKLPGISGNVDLSIFYN